MCSRSAFSYNHVREPQPTGPRATRDSTMPWKELEWRGTRCSRAPRWAAGVVVGGPGCLPTCPCREEWVVAGPRCSVLCAPQHAGLPGRPSTACEVARATGHTPPAPRGLCALVKMDLRRLPNAVTPQTVSQPGVLHTLGSPLVWKGDALGRASCPLQPVPLLLSLLSCELCGQDRSWESSRVMPG